MIRRNHTIKINLPGGIVSAGDLFSIVTAAEKARVIDVQFGTRQQIILKVADQYVQELTGSLQVSQIQFEVNSDRFPNIVSSYVTENVFGNSNWLSEGVYKDILDGFDYKPALKINIVDGDQTFVPFFTGNINFISAAAGNYWHLYIRFPKTTIIFRWKEIVYSQDIPRISKAIEEKIFLHKSVFFARNAADGNELYSMIQSAHHFVYGSVKEDLHLPDFTLPYYEGFNMYDNKSWLGIYRRDELFSLNFLKDACMICMQTKVGQLYTTPWKSLIIKGIEHADRKIWDYVLGKYRINVRHASNELNWQIEDNCEEGLNLKRYLIRQFDKEDVRTFGLCFAIKTQPNTGLFGSIIIRKLINESANQRKNLDRYDILYTKDFNPNSKDFILFRKNIEKENLGIYLVSLCKHFYELESKEELIVHAIYRQGALLDDSSLAPSITIFQCRHCLSVYDTLYGDEVNAIAPGTIFADIPAAYECPTCNAPKDDFVEIKKMSLIV
ncbi:MAG: rubredoxin [Chitinophagaceae bacterium]|nr:rubredoxin [Chitinophagaceae bacterium]